MTDAERIEQLEIQVAELEDLICTFLGIALIHGTANGDGLSEANVDALITDFAKSRAKNGQANGARLAERLRGIMER